MFEQIPTLSSATALKRQASSVLFRSFVMYRSIVRQESSHISFCTDLLPLYPYALFAAPASHASDTLNSNFRYSSQNFGSRTDTVFCVVFYGHGHFVAKRVRDSLPLKLRAEWEDNIKDADYVRETSPNTRSSLYSEDASFISADEESRVSFDVEETEKHPEVFQTLNDSFLKAYKFMDRELRSYNNINCFCSGTTAVTLVKQGQDLVIGNIGDSRAVLAMRDMDGSLVAVQLTVDLKPNLPVEAERIRKCKGCVFSLRNEPDVARVWLPNSNSPGLAMARAFGDFCLKDFGLISVPEIPYRLLTEKDKFIVLATDGIWDVLSNEEVVNIVASASLRSFAARSLVEAAVRGWKTKYPTSKVDDCAVVCLFLDSNSIVSSTAVQNKMIRLFEKVMKFQKIKKRKSQIERSCFLRRRRTDGLRLVGFLGPTHYLHCQSLFLTRNKREPPVEASQNRG